MKKYFFVALFLLGIFSVGKSQTLFTYGSDSISVTEFLNAYNKNNTTTGIDKAGMQNYLDLYIASRLKIKEAKEKGYDTLPQLVADLQGLREQIIPSYLIDDAATNKLVEEAILRSQKDIHFAHIFIATVTPTDTIDAFNKANEALKKIKKGESFTAVAKQYSDDPAVKINGGDAGFITVFSLPYVFENLVYKTPAGKISPLYHSKTGYHIFKNMGERKALGRMKAAQILIAFPPGSDAGTKAKAKKLADSLYNQILKGADFEKLATTFSNDVVSAASNGQMQEFGVGEFEPAFENKVFALNKDGQVSKPFATEHGWHIVKRLGTTPAATNKLDEKTIDAFKEKVAQSDRVNITKDALVQKILKDVKLKKLDFTPATLWTYTDSAIIYKKVVAPAIFNNNFLLQLGNKNVTVDEWYVFAEMNRYKADGSGIKSYEDLWEEFVSFMALEYYKQNLEKFNPAFKAQIEEFKDGNLFFEIMQQQIWGPAQMDTAALEKFYQQNKTKYVWKQSADAVIFYASDAETADELHKQLTKAPFKWKELTSELSEKVAVDSNRFELTSIPSAAKTPLKQGVLTKPVLNQTDNTASFAYIIKMYEQPTSRSFTEAKGLVINDYQAELEKKWIESLKKKYPVVINQKQWNELVNKK